MSDRQLEPIVIIGAGPAGLTAAYELTKHNRHPVVIEKYDKVGGLARTENYKGFSFDMGGHRFFTKAKAASTMWHEVLGEDLLRRPRLSRIYYNRKFFHYPLRPLNALFGLGIWQSLLIALSFIRWQIFPHKQENTFEQWVTNRFGQRLFQIFFKTYTEKVWGIPCSELKAEWAAQRIKNLSLKTALLAMFLKPKATIKSLIEEFHYPRCGPGMMWKGVQRQVEQRGGIVKLNSEVIRIGLAGNRIHDVTISANGSGEQTICGSHFISSMPVSEFVKRLDSAPREVVEAAAKLTYRDFLTVCLIVNKPNLFADNWLYIHSPGVKVGRIQNFKNWSPDMVPDQSKTSLGLEYFCTEGDKLWNMSDADLIELGKREVESIGLADFVDVEDGCVYRVPKAYPIYDADYRDYLEVVKNFIDGLENFQTIGRNGLHRYDNQDHAMVTGMLAANNLALGERNDIWGVNTDAEYHEEIRTEAVAEKREIGAVYEEAFARVFAKLDPVAFGLAVGCVAGLILFLATLVFVIRGEVAAVTYAELLNQYLPGYSATFLGSFIGLVYASALGFVGGWTFAYLRNLAVFVSAVVIHRDIELHLLWDLLDYM